MGLFVLLDSVQLLLVFSRSALSSSHHPPLAVSHACTPPLFSQCVSGDDAVAAGATLPVAMTMPLSPLSSDEEQQRMLGNSQHLYPGAEEEEEEEEEMDDDGMDEEGEEENGELELDDEEEVDDEDDIRRGPGRLRGGREEGHRQKGTMAGRLPGDRPIRPGNPGHAANPYSSNPGPTHQTSTSQQQQQQPQRKLRERSSSNAPDDTHVALMVFRIGIPDIKQTVSQKHTQPHTCSPIACSYTMQHSSFPNHA